MGRHGRLVAILGLLLLVLGCRQPGGEYKGKSAGFGEPDYELGPGRK